MSVTEAPEFFGSGPAKIPAAHAILSRMADVGLGYLTLGQPLTTLSGGERQRLKLAIQMATKGGIYVLDEPTSGLHLADVEQLLDAARPAGGRRQVGDRHRAPPRGDGARRLDHRPRPRRRPRRRAGRLRGPAGGPGRRPAHAHRPAPRGVRRRRASRVYGRAKVVVGRRRSVLGRDQPPGAAPGRKDDAGHTADVVAKRPARCRPLRPGQVHDLLALLLDLLHALLEGHLAVEQRQRDVDPLVLQLREAQVVRVRERPLRLRSSST